MSAPRVYVEAAERFARDAGMRWAHTVPSELVIYRNGVRISFPVTAGTISLTDALRILRGAG